MRFMMLNKNPIFPVPNPITSYWLSDPHKLKDVRSTPDLPSECDLVIIGSGMAGVSTAYHLLLDNPTPPQIVLIEARELCTGATGRNGGHSKVKVPTLTSVVAKHGDEFAAEFYANVYGIIDGLKHIVEEEGLDCEFELRRSFDVQTDAEETKRLKEIYDESRKAGASWTKNTSFIDFRYAEQITSIKGATSAFSVPAASFWPYKFVTQVAALLLDRHPSHFNIQTNTVVTSVAQSEDGKNLIRTPRGNISAPKVIFATNAYTSGLIPSFENVIVPVRGMATHLVPSKPIHPHLTHTYNIDFGPEKSVDYLNPRPDGSIVVGGGGYKFRNDRKSWFNHFDDSIPFSDDVQSYWKGYMQRTFLGWEDSGSEVDRTWVGIMGNTPDEFPHVGRVPGVEGQWVLAGFNGGGMALILSAGKAVAKMVREGGEFEDVRREFGVPGLFGTNLERLGRRFEEV